MSEHISCPESGRGISPDHPYLGLAPYTEREAALFFGRDRERRELYRQVRRDVATVLYGGSGLGKSSLIQAGLFPMLREADCLPILVRLDLSAAAPPVVTQVEQALRCSAREASVEVVATGDGSPATTLWELFHRIELWSPSNHLLTPVLVLDQFEELFTIGAGSSRAAELAVELEDLAENQIPAELWPGLKQAPDRIDFPYQHQDYRLIISLREDFLPPFEQLSERIPSLRRNRMRLGQLTPEAALEAVLRPGGALLDEEVAQEIVRFVADSTEHPFRRVGPALGATEGEVEPALLSLVCRELNLKRIERGRDRITADLLTESKLGILEDFYRRSLADLPAEVSVFVEEHLLTRSGFRNSIALEDAVGTYGVSEDHLARLVDRRLLRVEDRLGTRRVELTHDVLTRMIRKSRDRRRTAELDAERVERERERLRQRQLELEAQHEAQRLRIRWLAAAAGLLGLFAVVLLAVTLWAAAASVLAHRSARRAEAQRQSTNDVLNFLLFNIREMLEPVGRLDLVEQVANKVLQHSSTDDLSEDDARNAEVAHVILGDVRRARGDLAGAVESFEAAMTIASRLAERHRADPFWQQDLMVAHQRIGDVRALQGDVTGALVSARAAADIARRLADQNPEDRDRQRELAVSHIKIGDLLGAQGRTPDALASYRAAQAIMAALAAEDSKVPLWQSDLAGVHERIAGVVASEGDFDGALAAGQEALAVRRRLVASDPSNRPWQGDLARGHGAIGSILLARGDLDGARSAFDTAQVLWERLAELDPTNADWRLGVAMGRVNVAGAYRVAGELDDAVAELLASLATVDELRAHDPTNAGLRSQAAATNASLGDVQLARGRPMAALGRYRAALELAAELAGLDAANAQAARLVVFSHQRVGDALLAVGALPEAVASYREALARAQGLRHDHPASLLLAFDEADNLNRLSHALWSAGDRVAARDHWHAAVAVVRGLEGAAEPERRGALDGPLGAMTCCALFRKGADEGAAVELMTADSEGSRKVAAGVLGHRAWQALTESRATDAAALAENALEIDPSQVWLNLTLAHGLLLGGRQEAALELYRRYANHPVTDLETFREAALADLSELERAGVTVVQLAEVERALVPGAAR